MGDTLSAVGNIWHAVTCPACITEATARLSELMLLPKHSRGPAVAQVRLVAWYDSVAIAVRLLAMLFRNAGTVTACSHAVVVQTVCCPSKLWVPTAHPAVQELASWWSMNRVGFCCKPLTCHDGNAL